MRTLRESIKQFHAANQLIVISREVDPKFELNAVVRKIQEGPNLPVLFEKVKGTPYRVVSNTLGNYGIIAQLLGVGIDGVAARWARLTTQAGGAISDEHAIACDELEEISLDQVPHLTFSEKDAGPYLTASVIVARDPDTQVANLSFHRMQIVDGELRCRLSTSGDLYRIQQKCEARRQPLEAVVAIGLPPSVMLAGGTTIGPDVSEYDLAARISGKRFPLQPSPSLGLPVPRGTEFLIEGEILPDVRRREGPFGEWMDYYVPPTDNHVFRVRRVHARKDALFYAISAGSAEEIAMTALPIAGGVYANARTWVSGVKDVTCFPLLQFCAIQIDNKSEGQAQRAMMAAFGAEMNRVLYCVVVDEDVNIHNWQDVLWAMATRCRPDRDIMKIPGVPSFARDPHKMHWGRLGIDATKPIEHAAAFERKKTPGLAELKLEDYISSGATISLGGL